METRMSENTPNLVTSDRSRYIAQDGTGTDLCIYRLETDTSWILELVASDGTSTVWQDKFETDDAAEEEALSTLASSGMASFSAQ
jgi:hypothetical protein